MRNQLQSQLFDEILGKFPKKSTAVDTLSKLLGTGKDAIYRRFRGDTLLTPDEISLLCTEFNLSIDSFIYDKSDSVFFTFNPFTYEINNFKDFLLPIYNDLAAISKLPNTKVFYASAEIRPCPRGIAWMPTNRDGLGACPTKTASAPYLIVADYRVCPRVPATIRKFMRDSTAVRKQQDSCNTRNNGPR